LTDEFEGLRIDRFLRDLDWGRLMAANPNEWKRISRQEIEVSYPVHRFLSFYLVPIQQESSDERMPLATIILRDVSSIHVDTEKAMESEKLNAITTLAAGVAHEIGNQLNSLNIHLQLLRRHLDRIGDKKKLGKAGSDLDNDKLTFPRLYGLEESRAMASAQIRKAHKAVAVFGKKAEPLRMLADFIISRDH